MLKLSTLCVVAASIATVFGAPQRCDYATYTDANGGSYREALNLCFSSTEFGKSFKFVYDAEANCVDEFIYKNDADCSGTYDVNRGAPPTSLYNGGKPTGKTCASFGFFAKRQQYNEAGQLIKDKYGIYDGEKGRTFGQNNNPLETWVWFSSVLYGDCIPYWPGKNWVIIQGCATDDAGQSVLIWEWFSDPSCSTLIPENTPQVVLEDYNGGNLKASYTREIIKGAVHYTVEKTNSGHKFEVIAQDIMCYNAGTYSTAHAEQAPSDLYYNHDSPRSNWYHHAPPNGDWFGKDAGDSNDGWFATSSHFLLTNIMVSLVTTLCIVAVCLTMYRCIQKVSSKQAYTRVHVDHEWEKEDDDVQVSLN